MAAHSLSQFQPRESEPDFYVGVFGSFGVGKTSIINQFVHDVFQEQHDPTIEGNDKYFFFFFLPPPLHPLSPSLFCQSTPFFQSTDSYRKIFTLEDQNLLLDILDTSGQEEFASLQDSWIRTRDAFLFVIAYGPEYFFKSWNFTLHYIDKLLKSTNGNLASLPIVITATRIDEFPPNQYVLCDICYCLSKKKKKQKNLAPLAKKKKKKKKIYGQKKNFLPEKKGEAQSQKYKLNNNNNNNNDNNNNKKKKAYLFYVEKYHFGYAEVTAVNRLTVKDCFAQLIKRQNEISLGMGGITDTKRNASAQPSRGSAVDVWTELRGYFEKRLFAKEMEVEERLTLQPQVRLDQVSKEDVPLDKISLPVLALKEFRINKQFRWDILITSLMYGMILPLRLLWQLIAFCSFSYDKFILLFIQSLSFSLSLRILLNKKKKKKEPKDQSTNKQINFDRSYEELWIKYPRDLDYTRPEAISYDLLGLIVGRKEKYAPESDDDKAKQPAFVRNYRWFLNQSRGQLVERCILFVIASALYCLLLFHLYYASAVVYYNSEVSVTETAGPFCLYIVFWVLFSVWISYDVLIDPPLDPWHKLRHIQLYFGEYYEFKLSAAEFLRAYERAKLRSKPISSEPFFSLSTFFFFFFFCWVRIRAVCTTLFGRPLVKQFFFFFFFFKKKKGRTKLTIALVAILYALLPGITRVILGQSFIYSKYADVGISAIITNFILVQILLRTIEGQYVVNFNTYKTYMGDLTYLLTRRRNIRGQFGNLFLSLKRYSNALGWLEVRSFLAADGV
ncbi:hypothetical protein RFI_20655 [Reticulomyxa filosa]|uniref:Uncharacterized protein n=1 Tax=Reticulomyxa filosa TaxID=46433 RepID=X6MSM4_RETFI|nr:hypothetical protein RFI_20655 [Reticulomyxa filosa]|eukprot:ETO16686.1 hypothetical protein RFI_20655 [Reticulomyxa filosa]